MVPAIAILLAKNPAVDNYDLSCVREIVCGTAPLHHEVEKLLYQRFPGLVLRQGTASGRNLLSMNSLFLFYLLIEKQDSVSELVSAGSLLSP